MMVEWLFGMHDDQVSKDALPRLLLIEIRNSHCGFESRLVYTIGLNRDRRTDAARSFLQVW